MRRAGVGCQWGAVAGERRSDRASVKAIRGPYHMKRRVGVAGLKMSPRRIGLTVKQQETYKRAFH